MKRVLFVAGTRPEIIKISPLIDIFKRSKQYKIFFGLTGQHKELANQALDIESPKPVFNLNLQTANQSLPELTAMALMGLNREIENIQPDIIIIQGDTTTTLACALAAYYQQIPVAHIEAGLRTDDNYSPFPEEVNRKITSIISMFHFSPTNKAKENLIAEGHNESNIFVVGNTIIDALNQITYEIKKTDNSKRLSEYFIRGYNIQFKDKKTILVTIHRRESHGKILEEICLAIKEIARLYKEIQIIIPVHPNPNVKEIIYANLKAVDNIYLIQSLNYEHFIYLMMNSYLILTDSGGIQEEAISLGKPLIILRKITERLEAIEVGGAVLAGTDKKVILDNFKNIYENKRIYKEMSEAENPYGDGKASQYIYNIIHSKLKFINGE